jgi:hypothetical protein
MYCEFAVAAPFGAIVILNVASDADLFATTNVETTVIVKAGTV